MNELEGLKKKLGKTNELLDKLDEMLAQGEITEGKYKQLSKKYSDEVENLKNQIAERVIKQDFGIKTEEEERADRVRAEQERLRRQREEEERAQKERKAHAEAEIREKPRAKHDEIAISRPQKTRGSLFTEEVTLTNSIGMKFVPILDGYFMMGSPSRENEVFNSEGPVHGVMIRESFHLGIYPVTQREWKEMMGNNPSHFKGENLPVEQVSMNDINEFIKKLNKYEGTDKYRLPSEAEWEYAARSGTTTQYYFGDDRLKLGEYAWYDFNSGKKTHEVGQKKPNPWGLYDMYGNVWELVQDTFHSGYEGAPADGSAWEEDSPYRIIRGGSWNSPANFLRSAGRRHDSGYIGNDIGFRLMRD